MPRRNKRNAPTVKNTRRAVLYARVSSKEQEKEGYSIPAQLKLLKEYALAQGIHVVEEYVDVETAKQAGRANFNKMISYLKRHTTVRTLLVEKTDRLYRNFRDWVTVDELDVELHLVKEGVVVSKDSRSSEKFMHGIKVLMAKNFLDNLSEETSKGMTEKAEQGNWPSYAPLGYVNVTDPNGRRLIEVDPDVAPLVVNIFEWYSTGSHSLQEITKMARQAGLRSRKYNRRVPLNSIHKILRNRLYTGVFKWRGQLYDGNHEPLISHELWQQVQHVLDGRGVSKLRGSSHNFAFSGIIRCGHCGCALVAEIKKQKYIYYHCTGV